MGLGDGGMAKSFALLIARTGSEHVYHDVNSGNESFINPFYSAECIVTVTNLTHANAIKQSANCNVR